MYQQVIKLVRTASEHHQPFVALLFPVMRELGIYLGTEFAVLCSHGDERGTKIFLKYYIASSHTITLCNVIGSHASAVTSWVLMGVDFIQNILLCLWIVWNKKRYPYRIHDQINALQNLAVYELVEFQAISFVLVIAVAYYGPNSSIIGNISNSYWAFNEIKDIAQTLTNMSTLFLVDFSSTLVGGTILWFCCQINLLKAFVELQKEFKIAFCVTFGRQLLAVCKNTNSMDTKKEKIFLIIDSKRYDNLINFLVLECKFNILGPRCNNGVCLDTWKMERVFNEYLIES